MWPRISGRRSLSNTRARKVRMTYAISLSVLSGAPGQRHSVAACGRLDPGAYIRREPGLPWRSTAVAAAFDDMPADKPADGSACHDIGRGMLPRAEAGGPHKSGQSISKN